MVPLQVQLFELEMKHIDVYPEDKVSAATTSVAV